MGQPPTRDAVLPILCAALLADGPVEITNVPNLHDVATTARLLRELPRDYVSTQPVPAAFVQPGVARAA